MKKIALCLIVRNEAAVILRCIRSCLPFIDYIYIEDTGSTDSTVQVINDFLSKGCKLPGHVHRTSWQNFAYNRSEALRRARQIPGIDYLLMIDADEVLIYQSQEVIDRIKEIKSQMVADCYYIETRMAGVSYVRPQITSTKKDFYYRGVVHEFLDCQGEFTSGLLQNISNKPIQDGARSKDPEKFRKDAEMLEAAMLTESDPKMLSRYTFYCAQSWRDAGNDRKALQYYLKASQNCSWNQEIYYSLYQSAKLKSRLNYPQEQVLTTYCKAMDVISNRGEAFYEAMKLCRENKWYVLGWALAQLALTLAPNHSALFSETWVYEYGIMDEASILAYYVGEYKASKQLCEKLLLEKKYPETQEKRIKANLQYALNKL